MCERFFLETHHHHYHKIEFLPERHCNDNNKHIYNSIYNIIRETQTRMVERFLPSNSYRNVKTSYRNVKTSYRNVTNSYRNVTNSYRNVTNSYRNVKTSYFLQKAVRIKI